MEHEHSRLQVVGHGNSCKFVNRRHISQEEEHLYFGCHFGQFGQVGQLQGRYCENYAFYCAIIHEHEIRDVIRDL